MLNKTDRDGRGNNQGQEAAMTRNRHNRTHADSTERRMKVRALALELLRNSSGLEMMTLLEATKKASAMVADGWRADVPGM